MVEKILEMFGKELAEAKKEREIYESSESYAKVHVVEEMIIGLELMGDTASVEKVVEMLKKELVESEREHEIYGTSVEYAKVHVLEEMIDGVERIVGK